ncbi:MAG: RluA family pseudouridine synthase, partial [Rickettsiales bacterium]|nr:RluA family pseudouridine synthase [Rickettsiales bacterium]
WLARKVGGAISRSRIQKLAREGHLADKAGAAVSDTARRVSAGEAFRLGMAPRDCEKPPVPENLPLDILYEDDDIIVINKAAGMVIHRGNGVENGTLVNALLYHTSGRLSSIGIEAGRQGIVHRLDKDTSGAMVACKSDAAHIAMYKMFEKHLVRRDYTALVWGSPQPKKGVIKRNIARNPRFWAEMRVVVEGGKEAVTHYDTIKTFTRASIVRCNLETGRTHQIRVHMKFTGTPIIGDATYGMDNKFVRSIADAEERRAMAAAGRQMLHSSTISFSHPVSGKPVELEAPMPNDMLKLIDFLNRRA